MFEKIIFVQFVRKLFYILSIVLCISCVKEEVPSSNTRQGNFEALWQLMDQRYCFFDYKKEQLGVDWDEVHTRYAAMVNDKMTNQQLFEVLCNMIGELRDGHVNLSAVYDLGRNWSYYEDYDRNYDAELIEHYLGKGNDYQIASSLKYRILDDNIAYVRCETFNNPIGDGNLSLMLDNLKGCNGLILDVRNNGGGSLVESERLASRFTNEKTLVGYIYHKTGKGRNDFSSPEPVYVTPSDGVRWQKQVVVLANRETFSAANDFVKSMKRFPLVTVMGDQTGGGSGMPFNQELPNGWGLRFSAVVFLDADRQHIEFGIKPDIPVALSQDDALKGKDSLIEAARAFLSQ